MLKYTSEGRRQKRKIQFGGTASLPGFTLTMLVITFTCRHQASSFKVTTRKAPFLLRRRNSPFVTSTSPFSSLCTDLSLFPDTNPHSERSSNSPTSNPFQWRLWPSTNLPPWLKSIAHRHGRRRHLSSLHTLTGERVKAVLEGSPSSSPSSLGQGSFGGESGSSHVSDRHSYPLLEKLDKMKVKDLRLELAVRGLDNSGKRDELHSRLKSVLKAEADGKENALDDVDDSQNDEIQSSPSSALDEDSSSTKPIVDPSSLDREQPYILMVRSNRRPNFKGVGIGMALHSCTRGEATRSGSRVIRGDELWSGRVYLDSEQTMFEADYSGLLVAFEFATKVLKIRKLHIQVQNDALVRQLEGKYIVNKPKLRAMMDMFYEYEDQMLSSSEMDYVELSLFSIDESPTVLSHAENALVTRRSSNLLSDKWDPKDPCTVASKVVKDSASTKEFIRIDVENAEEEDVAQDIQQQEPYAQKQQDDGMPVVSENTTIDPSKTYLLQFDGGSRGNPGIAGAGMVLYELNDNSVMEESREIWCGWKFHSEQATNNLAEYLGLLCGLKCAKSLGIRRLIVEGDSQLIVRHITGQYRCKEQSLRQFYNAALDIIENDLDSFEIRHIPRSENSRADALANHAMDTQESGGFVSTTK